MNEIRPGAWSRRELCISDSYPAYPRTLQGIAPWVYPLVCRINFQAPGFCLLDLSPIISSLEIRQSMFLVKDELRKIHRQRSGRDLALLSAGQFDQQITTKFHRDGGPDECFLMLGYEPTPVTAAIHIAHFSKCAFDLGMTPGGCLEHHNPMFGPGEALHRAYTTGVDCFSLRAIRFSLSITAVRRGLTWRRPGRVCFTPQPSTTLPLRYVG